jgi:hypothetical protein
MLLLINNLHKSIRDNQILLAKCGSLSRTAKCDHVCFEKTIFLNFYRQNLALF